VDTWSTPKSRSEDQQLLSGRARTCAKTGVGISEPVNPNTGLAIRRGRIGVRLFHGTAVAQRPENGLIA
jgi:hypothetical protein